MLVIGCALRILVSTDVSPSSRCRVCAQGENLHAAELLLLLLKVLRLGRARVLLEPLVRLLDRVEDRLLVLLADLATKPLLVGGLVLELEGKVLEAVACFDALAGGFILIRVLPVTGVSTCSSTPASL